MKPARGPQTRFFCQSLLWNSAYTKAWDVIDWGSIKQSLKQILTEINIVHMHVILFFSRWQLVSATGLSDKAMPCQYKIVLDAKSMLCSSAHSTQIETQHAL